MGHKPTLKTTPLALQTIQALKDGERYVVHEGGTRSSKTQSIAQALIIIGMEVPLEIDVVRESMPVLRRSAYKDFKEWLKKKDLYSSERHDKTNEVIGLPADGGMTTVRFYGVDEEQKLQGPERDIVWINEANEIGGKVFRQIRRRTRRSLVMDYNPSHGATHWIDQDVVDSPRSTVIRSTYRDNPFLPAPQVKDIEADVPVYREAGGSVVIDWTLEYDGDGVLIAGDPAEWAVNGLGKRAKSDRIIFPHWTTCDRLPEQYDDRAFGLDFGWNAPCVLIECRWKDVVGEDVNLYWHEHFRGTKMKNEDLADELEDVGVPPHVPIYCDHEPDRIDELKEAGYKAKEAKKDDYEAGVRTVKNYRLRVTRASQKTQEELEQLKWATDTDGEILDEPVKKNDHGPDAGRYATHTHKQPSTGGAGGSVVQRGNHSSTSHPGVHAR